jgi:hypothetical protein
MLCGTELLLLALGFHTLLTQPAGTPSHMVFSLPFRTTIGNTIHHTSRHVTKTNPSFNPTIPTNNAPGN